MLTLNELRRYADRFLKETYGMKLVIPLELNGRLKRACGRFVYYSKTLKPKTVEMNKEFVSNNSPSVVLSVLKHELVHYALFMQGKPHSDGHPVFERELRRLGIVSQKTINNYKIFSKVQLYKCKDCNHEFKRTRRLSGNIANYRCNCGGKLIDRGKVVVG